MPKNKIRSTTVLCVRKNGKVAIGGDGQVSMGNTVMKNTAKKNQKALRRKNSFRLCRLGRGCVYSLRTVRKEGSRIRRKSFQKRGGTCKRMENGSNASKTRGAFDRRG